MMLNKLDKKIIFIFVTQTKAGKHNSIFALNSNVLVLFFYEARFLRDVQLKFDENLYLYYKQYIHNLKVTVGDFVLHFACGTSLLNVQQ